MNGTGNEKSLLREEVQQALNSDQQLGRRRSCGSSLRKSWEEEWIFETVEALREEVHRFDEMKIQESTADARWNIAMQLCVFAVTLTNGDHRCGSVAHSLVRANDVQASATASGAHHMSSSKSDVVVASQRDGKWSFVLTFRGVTHPAVSGFTSQLQAQAAGMAALKALEGRH